MQAAATFHSAYFDDYGYGSNDNPYTGYSAESHGTYGQPAMSHGGHAESYVMSMGVGGFGNGSAGAGYEYAAAGIGAAGGAVAMQSARSRKAPTPLSSAPVVPAITQVTKSGLRTLLSPDLVHNRMRSTIKAVVFPG